MKIACQILPKSVAMAVLFPHKAIKRLLSLAINCRIQAGLIVDMEIGTLIVKKNVSQASPSGDLRDRLWSKDF